MPGPIISGIPMPPLKRQTFGLSKLMLQMKPGDCIDLAHDKEFNSCRAHASFHKAKGRGVWRLSKPLMRCWRVE